MLGKYPLWQDKWDIWTKGLVINWTQCSTIISGTSSNTADRQLFGLFITHLSLFSQLSLTWTLTFFHVTSIVIVWATVSVHAGKKFCEYVFIQVMSFLIWFIWVFFVCIFMCNFTLYHVYYHWIFGSPLPTVCKLVFFHSHLASGLQLWKFPFASMHLHFFVWKWHYACACTLIPD